MAWQEEDRNIAIKSVIIDLMDSCDYNSDSDYLRMRVEEEQPNRVSALDLTGYLFMGHSSTGCNQSPSAVEGSSWL